MRATWTGIALFALIGGLAGCDTSSSLTGVLSGGSHLGTERISEVEPNDTFEEATQTPVDVSTLWELSGTMTSIVDVDIYDLGPVPAGDRITVSVDNDPGMNLAAALFDEQHCLIASNDDRYWQIDQRPELGVTLRRSCQHCYLVVTASPQASSCKGPYTATVLHEQGSVPAARPQTVYLSFNGAKGITLPTRDPVDIPAFNAASIDSTFAGQTAAMISAIVATVRSQYAAFNVQVLSSTESPSIPSDATVIYFGTYDPNLLGLADSVDEYNADLTQKAIVFSDTFRLFMPLKPTLQQMATAIANVASHESGHLLGLEHTQQWTDLMDTTSPAQALLDVQHFETAPLYKDVFPLGLQNSPQLLAEAVGLRQMTAALHIDRYDDFANTVTVAESGPSAITDGVASGFQHASRAAEVLPESWRLLLYGQGSVQDEVTKDSFAVHSHRSAAR